MVKNLIRDRVENVRRTARREADILRRLADDVKERVDLDPSTEPRGSAGMGGVFGEQGAVPKSIAKALIETGDNAMEHIQDFARDNRQVVRRVR